jgi:hypothetical protein
LAKLCQSCVKAVSGCQGAASHHEVPGQDLAVCDCGAWAKKKGRFFHHFIENASLLHIASLPPDSSLFLSAMMFHLFLRWPVAPVSVERQLVEPG